MNETQSLLGKITALRQRLEQAQGLAHALSERVGEWEGGVAVAAAPVETLGQVRRLERQAAEAARQHTLLDMSIRQLPGGDDEPVVRPTQLTARARRLLGNGRELLARLRALADDFEQTADPTRRGDAVFRRIPELDPLSEHYRQTLAIADAALRLVQAYPDAPSAQLRLCDGLEATLQVVADRLGALDAAVAERRRQNDQVQTLANLLIGLETGDVPALKSFLALAEALLAEAQRDAALRFLYEAPQDSLPRFVACHGLAVAQVMARLVRHDPELRGQAVEAVVAALVHDVGMLRLPIEIVAYTGVLADEERRVVESHTRIGAELVGQLSGPASWTDAALGHHERLDGTGYPAGLRELQIAPLIRLLAICDIYAAMCAPRPHRAALQPRTALTDTLLLADKGALDRARAEHLLLLSFYPVGSLVELNDGSIGRVVATHQNPRDLTKPDRPVLALLTDAHGRPLPTPHYHDLAHGDGPSIVRTVPMAEARQLVGRDAVHRLA